MILVTFSYCIFKIWRFFKNHTYMRANEHNMILKAVMGCLSWFSKAYIMFIYIRCSKKRDTEGFYIKVEGSIDFMRANLVAIIVHFIGSLLFFTVYYKICLITVAPVALNYRDINRNFRKRS
jgi:hypothetical protein